MAKSDPPIVKGKPASCTVSKAKGVLKKPAAAKGVLKKPAAPSGIKIDLSEFLNDLVKEWKKTPKDHYKNKRNSFHSRVYMKARTASASYGSELRSKFVSEQWLLFTKKLGPDHA